MVFWRLAVAGAGLIDYWESQVRAYKGFFFQTLAASHPSTVHAEAKKPATSGIATVELAKNSATAVVWVTRIISAPTSSVVSDAKGLASDPA